MLELKNISKTYAGKPLLADISFTIASGQTLCLLGASGSGKSTLLRIIAGLESPDAGRVCWGGADLASVPPHLRDFGLVFQDYALFPHLNVFDNIAFGLRMKKNTKAQRRGATKENKNFAPSSLSDFVLNSKTEIEQRVAEVLEIVNLRGFESRRVTDLSGGEQQRVALARALAPRPRLLMFDEPLGALDRALKDDLLKELRAILRHANIPAIYVTHDQEEAFAIADRILLLHEGVILREGAPAEVWDEPRSAWAAQFLGVGNVVTGKVSKVSGVRYQVNTGLGVLKMQCKHRHGIGERVSLLLRASGEGLELKARVDDVVFNRDRFRVALRGGLTVEMGHAPKIGSEIKVAFAVECLGDA